MPSSLNAISGGIVPFHPTLQSAIQFTCNFLQIWAGKFARHSGAYQELGVLYERAQCVDGMSVTLQPWEECTCYICSYCHHSCFSYISYNRLLYSYQHRLRFLMYFADTGFCCYLLTCWKLYFICCRYYNTMHWWYLYCLVLLRITSIWFMSYLNQREMYLDHRNRFANSFHLIIVFLIWNLGKGLTTFTHYCTESHYLQQEGAVCFHVMVSTILLMK